MRYETTHTVCIYHCSGDPGVRLRHMERHRGKRPYGRRVAVEMKINPVSAIFQAITHWRDQRQRRKREKAVRTAEAQLTAARERLAEHEAWSNAFNKRSDRLVGGITHDELVDILREQSDQS